MWGDKGSVVEGRERERCEGAREEGVVAVCVEWLGPCEGLGCVYESAGQVWGRRVECECVRGVCFGRGLFVGCVFSHFLFVCESE